MENVTPFVYYTRCDSCGGDTNNCCDDIYTTEVCGFSNRIAKELNWEETPEGFFINPSTGEGFKESSHGWGYEEM